MTNKPLLGFIVVLLLAIAGYLSYLAWDRHQHNLAEQA
jgi:predicted negative regulator of RcsB-dependent stress response